MKTCCSSTPIEREGTGQFNRFIDALDPQNAPVDSRSFSDMLLYTQKLSELIRFYPLNETCENITWKQFFETDFALLATEIGQINLFEIENNYIQIRIDVEKKPTVEALKRQLDVVISIAKLFDVWLKKASPDFSIYHDVALAIRSELREQILRSSILDKTAMLINEGEDLGIDFDEFKENDFIWDLQQQNIPIDTKIFIGDTKAEQIYQGSVAIDTLFNASFNVLKKFVGNAERYLQNALEEYPKHRPQMALFLAFLQLFRLAQEQINGITERHLNYYFREILHLKEKKANPDHVNLIFELAKNNTAHLLPKGTTLSAGKDKNGIEQIYVTDNEIVLNKTQIKELKSFIIQRNNDGNLTGFYARPIANSADGFGKEFVKKPGKWHPFAVDAIKKQTTCGTTIDKVLPQSAKIGFALASPMFRMESGSRNVQLKIVDLTSRSKMAKVSVNISTQKQPLALKNIAKEAEIQITSVEVMASVRQKEIMEPIFLIGDDDTIVIGIPASTEPIVAQNDFPSEHPYISFTFEPYAEGFKTEKWENWVLNPSECSVEVNVRDYKNFQIENEAGNVDTTQSFYPFTQVPSYRSFFLVGSQEIFSKPLFHISLNAAPLSNIGISYLDGKQWRPLEDSNEIFYQRKETVPPTYSHQANCGFLKIQLNEEKIDFSKNAYDYKIVQQVAEQTKLTDLSLNYSAKIDGLDESFETFFHIYPFGVSSIPYAKFSENQSLETGLNSYGLSLQQGSDFGGKIPLLPNFRYGKVAPDLKCVKNLTNIFDKNLVFAAKKDNSLGKIEVKDTADSQSFDWRRLSLLKTNQYHGATPQEAYFFIGLEEVQPSQNLSLLIQVAEGTAFNDRNEPPLIRWSYVAGSELKPLEANRLLMDSSYGLQTTGILHFQLPADASSNSTLVTKGLFWLVASVDNNSDCLPFLIDIKTQAVRATFVDDEKATQHLKNPLPAESISKLNPKVVQIKSVSQPFESFGGIATENSSNFWVRVSERIKHKQRAITLQDYEKLTLTAFPSIFKVKAIGYTDPSCICQEAKDEPLANEHKLDFWKILNSCCGASTAPGHITILPIEYLKNRNSLNVLNPKISRRILLEIEAYLQNHTSTFVKVHAKNPIYEEVLSAFRVRFIDNVDQGFYLNQLNEDLKQYLTPWAFDASADVIFNNKIYASEVIHFIEKLPYVDYVSDFMLFHWNCDCCSLGKYFNTLLDIITHSEELKKVNSLHTANDFWQLLHDQSDDLIEFIYKKSKTWNSYTNEEKLLLLEVIQWFFEKLKMLYSDVDVAVHNLEKLAKSLPNFTMGTIIEASSEQALLVSAAKHIILLDEKIPEVLCPKQSNRLKK